MEKYQKRKINEDKCKIHSNNNYLSYCFDCNKHLCKECLITREHFYHNKNSIIEIKPVQQELDIIK